MTNSDQSVVRTIIEYARWAPSGDNTQTWRFETLAESHFVIHGYDTRDYCVYDLQGHAMQMSLGTLVENIAIAASSLGHHAEFILRENMPETNPTIDVRLTKDSAVISDLLFPYLPIRTVQRRALRTTRLCPSEKMTLEASLGNFYSLHWFEGWKHRFQIALLLFKYGKLRLTLPEAYSTHCSVIEWNARFSHDRIPDQAVGVDILTTRLMKWAMKSWSRIKFLNTYFAGTLIPRIEMDFIPGLFCGAHFIIIANEIPTTVQDRIDAGRALQRFWLTSTQLNLQLQPATTPLMFSGYIRNKIAFTKNRDLVHLAETLSRKLVGKIGVSTLERTVFFGRIGRGTPARARALRLSVEQLSKPIVQ